MIVSALQLNVRDDWWHTVELNVLGAGDAGADIFVLPVLDTNEEILEKCRRLSERATLTLVVENPKGGMGAIFDHGMILEEHKDFVVLFDVRWPMGPLDDDVKLILVPQAEGFVRDKQQDWNYLDRWMTAIRGHAIHHRVPAVVANLHGKKGDNTFCWGHSFICNKDGQLVRSIPMGETEERISYNFKEIV